MSRSQRSDFTTYRLRPSTIRQGCYVLHPRERGHLRDDDPHAGLQGRGGRPRRRPAHDPHRIRRGGQVHGALSTLGVVRWAVRVLGPRLRHGDGLHSARYVRGRAVPAGEDGIRISGGILLVQRQSSLFRLSNGFE